MLYSVVDGIKCGLFGSTLYILATKVLWDEFQRSTVEVNDGTRFQCICLSCLSCYSFGVVPVLSETVLLSNFQRSVVELVTFFHLAGHRSVEMIVQLASVQWTTPISSLNTRLVWISPTLSRQYLLPFWFSLFWYVLFLSPSSVCFFTLAQFPINR